MPLFYDKEVKVFKTSCGPFDNNAYCFSPRIVVEFDVPSIELLDQN